MYHKSTDSFNYITFDSGHPRHQKVNIPFNMARRIRTIVSGENQSEQRSQDLKTILQNKRYPRETHRRWNRESLKYPKEELRKTKRLQENNNINITYVTTYNQNNPNVLSTIRNTLPLLKQSPQMNKIVDKIKIVNSQRQPPNLKRILTRARLQPDDKAQKNKVTKCNQSLCGTCSN